jgi:hypothetical protein
MGMFSDLFSNLFKIVMNCAEVNFCVGRSHEFSFEKKINANIAD